MSFDRSSGSRLKGFRDRVSVMLDRSRSKSFVTGARESLRHVEPSRRA